MTVASVSMPESLLERSDEFADEHGYTGRSEIIREASRNLLGEFKDTRLEDRELMGIVTVLFDYNTTTVEEKISAFVGKIRATKDTLNIDYSVVPVDDFGRVTE
jgi:CopG family nickel-responsive transcriptional regulator